MMNIPVIFCFARSGGTLVNQLLGAHPDCSILSEINPAASVVSMARQASNWLSLIDKTDVDQFQELPYSQQIVLLDERAKSRRKMLIIRDWVTINYLPGAGGNSIVPSSILEQLVYLERVGYSLRPLVVTRKANSVYWSLRRNFAQLENLSVDDFAPSYLAYAHAVSSFPRVSLEALQSSPRETLVTILHALGVSTDYVDRQLETFCDFNQCTGNNTLAVPSETTRARRITPTGTASGDEDAFLEIGAIAQADRLFGYEK